MSGTELEIDPHLAMSWCDALLEQPKAIGTVGDFVSIAACSNSLRNSFDLPLLPFGPHLHPHIQQICERGDTMPINRLIDYPGLFAAQANQTPARQHPTALQALKDAAFSPTNLAANTAGVAHFIDSLYQSRPATSVIKMSEWELVDANKTARKNAFGKAGKAKYPPRMVLRAKAKLPTHMLPEGGRVTASGQTRIPSKGGKTISEILKLNGMNKMKPISDKAYQALKARAGLLKYGGPALTFGPSAAVDIKNTVWQDPSSKQNWKNLAVASAKSQSSNAVGFIGGMAGAQAIALGAALVFGVTVGAPVLLVGGLIVGIGAQATFGYFMLDDAAAEGVSNLLN